MKTEKTIISEIQNNYFVTKLPLIKDILNQKWTYSHYIHGNVAYKAGKLSEQPMERVLQVAIAVEVVWAAILILDDIVDSDEIRYHKASAWKQAGYGPATMEMFDGVLSGIQIVEDHKIREHLIKATKNTVSAMRIIAGADVDSTIDDLEPAYRELGALSAFSISWPWNNPLLEEIAFNETCAGQLINDCNDCFGPKAKRRNFPDLRNRQATLLFGILNLTNKNIIKRVLDAKNQEDRVLIAKDIHVVLQNDSGKLFGAFNRWMDQAAHLGNSAKNISLPVRSWLLSRINENKNKWHAKLKTLIERDFND